MEILNGKTKKRNMINYIKLVLVTLLLASCAQTKPTFKQEDISIVPKPTSFQLKESSFQFKANTTVVVQDKSQQKAANYLLGLFKTAAGFNLQIKNKTSENAIVFENVEGLKEGAYRLEVNPNSINIKASEESGFFNAVQTIRQLLPVDIESKEKVQADWFVPCVAIEDEPRFTWRGMHNDFSRHFIVIDEVKSFFY